MGSVRPPISGEPHDPYEGYRVEPIEQDRQAKEDQGKKPLPEEPPPEKQSAFFAYLLQLAQKLFDVFEELPGKGSASEKEVRERLLLFKAAFETMKKEERSQDVPFLNQLSKIWQGVLEDALRFKRSSLPAQELKTLIDAIQHYPANQPHTLGYYLSEYAGQKWLPFPYMEMIQKIHAEHLQNPSSSALSQWTQQIDDLLFLMKSPDSSL